MQKADRRTEKEISSERESTESPGRDLKIIVKVKAEADEDTGEKFNGTGIKVVSRWEIAWKQ